MGKAFTKQEIEVQKGKYDEDGFYILDDGAFYDDLGYYFNKDGYDEFGGFYDKETGYYVPGDAVKQEYDHNYGLKDATNPEQQQYLEGEDEDEGDELTEEDQKIDMQASIQEHVYPAIIWLKQQPEGKKFAVKMSNAPRRAQESNILKYL